MRAQHFTGAATVSFNGDRAVAETRMILMVQGAVGGVPVDVTCHGRVAGRQPLTPFASLLWVRSGRSV